MDAPDDLIGTWTSDEKGNPTLTFDADGTVTGTDGCNGIVTAITVDGDRILIEETISTLRACIGVDDWLRGLREVAVDGDTLRVMDEDGTEIGTLAREDS